MDRREFIAASAASALVLATGGCLPSGAGFAAAPSTGPERDPLALEPDELDEAPAAVRTRFDALLVWMQAAGWTAYLKEVAGVDLDPRSPGLEGELFRTFSPPTAAGFEDFRGVRAIQPGFPARSLLYHALASPKVRLPPGGGMPAPLAYPSVEQLDALEDYVYARLRLEAYRVSLDQVVLAVFAYEYRPADKTPHGAHGDLVYSRTGIARIGNREPNYAPEHRCHVNRPATAGSAQDIAVTPARYALFLARRVVGQSNLSLVNVEMPRDNDRTFLLPFRKVFTGDAVLGGASVFFSESHLNEKLARLEQDRNIDLPPGMFDTGRPPFVRRSATSTAPGFDGRGEHDTSLVRLEQTGSSVLVMPVPGPLVRPAVQDVAGGEQRVRIRVPPYRRAWYSSDVSNRRYTTLKVEQHPNWNAVDFTISDGLAGGGDTRTTGLRSPRNAPVFINIRHLVEDDGVTIRHLGPSPANYQLIRQGNYWAALFEDGICDGCVEAVVTHEQGGARWGGLEGAPILRAFSLVTAPDLFPLVDGADLEALDDHFLEGGTEMLSGGRLRANPNVWRPGTREPAFPDPRLAVRDDAYTISAVLTDRVVHGPWHAGATRDYVSTNTLPDTASNVFAPGWDVTYSGPRGSDFTVHLSTMGLGSPFPEDIKLCAAANGMWPGASPDAARTFQGNLKPLPSLTGTGLRPPTAVPLMDRELGFHPDSPGALEHGEHGRGWDGEYGPFLLRAADSWIHVNFADVNASDYVQNALAMHMNVALLRDLSTGELIARMDALRRCLRHLPRGGRPRKTRLWLISAEPVENWNEGARGYGIGRALLGGDTRWATVSRLSHAGHGYLYVFADARGDRTPVADGSRLTQKCAALYVCQVGGGRLAWVRVAGQQATPPAEGAWTVVQG